jgi:hypothetical protein
MSTLVAQTISNGTVSTSSANVIQGSAKAWVSFNNSGTINASYNISSLTKTGTGLYTIVMTTAMSDANYCVNLGVNSIYSNNANGSIQVNPAITFNSSQFGVMTGTPASAALGDCTTGFAAVFR